MAIALVRIAQELIVCGSSLSQSLKHQHPLEFAENGLIPRPKKKSLRADPDPPTS
jgi:hypothetical protein